MAFWKKDAQSPAPQPVAVALQCEGDTVRVLVDGVNTQELPRPAYEAMRRKLAGEPDRATNGFLLEIGAEEQPRHVLLRLPPAGELGPSPLPLQTDDARRYGRRYRMEIIEVEKNKKVAVIRDRQTGAETGRIPWEEFAKRATADLWRSDTPYRRMLGEHDPERHLKLLARRYRPAAAPPAAPPPGAAEAQKPPVVAEAPPGEPGETTAPITDGRQWLNRHPAVAVLMCAVGIVIIFIGLCRALATEPPVYHTESAGVARLDESPAGRISQCEALVNRFELIAADDHDAAAYALHKVRGLIITAPKLSLNEDELKRVKALEEALPKLENILERRSQP